MRDMRRRGFLSLAALGLASVGGGGAGCAATAGAASNRHRAATYITDSYDDLYPGITAFVNTATARSQGRLSFDLFDAGTLLGAEQLLPGMLLGVADVMFQTSSYVSSTYPILGAMELPFNTGEFAAYRRAIEPAGPLHELINEQLAEHGVRLLGGIPTSFEYLWSVDKPIRSPEDMRGMRIRVAGEIEGETIKALGGAPVSMGSSEVYQALERGTIDGLVSYIGTVVSRDLHEIVRYGTVAHFGAYTVDAYCRSEWYQRQEPASRAALDAGAGAIYGGGTETMLAVHEHDYLPSVRAAGVELIEPTPSEQAAFERAVVPVYQRWRASLARPKVAEQALELIRHA